VLDFEKTLMMVTEVRAPNSTKKPTKILCSQWEQICSGNNIEPATSMERKGSNKFLSSLTLF